MKEWETFLNAQERELGADTIRKWLRPLKIVNFDACNLYLKAADSFQASWFEEHMRKIAEKTLVNHNNRQITVHLSIANAPSPNKEPAKTEKAAPFTLKFDEIGSDATFDALISFPGNELAMRLLQDLELGSFNPIFLYGRAGAGKTHFLMATALALRARGLKTIYVRGERFAEHVVRAIRSGQMQLFREIYRKADVLIIDDVQVLARKAATQEELHHTFNTLHIEGKQLIFSANGAPQELRFIEPRLISRFEWGIVVPLEEPDHKTLGSVLKAKAEALKLPLAPDIIPYLLKTFQSTSAIRALEALGLRVHLAKHPISERRPLSLPIAQTHLADLIKEEERAAITPEKIITTVAAHYSINSDDILGKSQKKEVSLPRQIAMYLCRKRLRLPFVKIGDLFSRDHSTVMTSVRRIEKQVNKTQSELGGVVNAVTKQLTQ